MIFVGSDFGLSPISFWYTTKLHSTIWYINLNVFQCRHDRRWWSSSALVCAIWLLWTFPASISSCDHDCHPVLNEKDNSTRIQSERGILVNRTRRIERSVGFNSIGQTATKAQHWLLSKENINYLLVECSVAKRAVYEQYAALHLKPQSRHVRHE